MSGVGPDTVGSRDSTGGQGRQLICDVEQLAERAARLGILISLAAPASIAVVAVVLCEGRLVHPLGGQSASLHLLFYVLGAVALMELVAAFVVRRTLFTPCRVAPFCHDAPQVERWAMRSSAVVFALGASPMIYGAVIYLLGGDLRQLAFFGMVTLLAYRLLRPTADLIEEVLNAAANL